MLSRAVSARLHLSHGERSARTAPGEGFMPLHQMFTPSPNPLPMGEGAMRPFPVCQRCSRLPEILPGICVQRGQPGTCVGDRKISGPTARLSSGQSSGMDMAAPGRARRIRRDGGRAASTVASGCARPQQPALSSLRRASRAPLPRHTTLALIQCPHFVVPDQKAADFARLELL